MSACLLSMALMDFRGGKVCALPSPVSSTPEMRAGARSTPLAPLKIAEQLTRPFYLCISTAQTCSDSFEVLLACISKGALATPPLSLV